MLVNGSTLLHMAPIKDMIDHKVKEHGVSHGLGEAGYDIRIKQDITFIPIEYNEFGKILRGPRHKIGLFKQKGDIVTYVNGNFCLTSAMEEFQIPPNLAAVVHDKSTWARKGLSVFNTVLEPGWNGHLTLELVFHGSKPLHIPAGAGIAQVLFHRTTDDRQYSGKYQNQADEPVKAIFETTHHQV